MYGPLSEMSLSSERLEHEENWRCPLKETTPTLECMLCFHALPCYPTVGFKIYWEAILSGLRMRGCQKKSSSSSHDSPCCEIYTTTGSASCHLLGLWRPVTANWWTVWSAQVLMCTFAYLARKPAINAEQPPLPLPSQSMTPICLAFLLCSLC
jgi:hypothetical protein